MSETVEKWRVIVTMRPLNNGFDEGPFQFEQQGSDRFDARNQAYHSACMNGTVSIEVYSPQGMLEYEYYRSDNAFRPVSEEAKRIHAEEMKEIYTEMRHPPRN